MKIALAPAKFFLILSLLATATACKKQSSPVQSFENAKGSVAKDTPTPSSAKTLTTPTADTFDADRIKRQYSDRGYRLQYVNGDPTGDFVMSTVRNCAAVFKCSSGKVSSIEIHTMAFDVNANDQEEAFEKIKLGHDEVGDAAVVIYPTASSEIKRWYASCLERGLPKPRSSESAYFGPFLYAFDSNDLNVTVTIWPNH